MGHEPRPVAPLASTPRQGRCATARSRHRGRLVPALLGVLLALAAAAPAGATTTTPSDEPSPVPSPSAPVEPSPSDEPTPPPSDEPTPPPSDEPTPPPSDDPTPSPSDEPTRPPSTEPTPAPTPTGGPTQDPTEAASPGPTDEAGAGDEPTPSPGGPAIPLPPDDLATFNAGIVDTGRAISEAMELLGRTREEIVEMTARLRESAATVAAYEAELAELEQALARAESDERSAATRASRARTDLAVLEGLIETAEARLGDRQVRLEERAASAFMYGEANMAGVIVGARSVHDVVTTTYYLRRVLLADVDVVDEVVELRTQLDVARTDAELLRQQVELDLTTAEQARLEAEDLVATYEALAELAEEERGRRAELLRALEVHEAATQAELADLVGESTAISGWLRTIDLWRDVAPTDGSWAWPTAGTVGSPFGYRTHPIFGGAELHAGVDIAAPLGQPIVAANAGRVVVADCAPTGYGCRIVIDHGGGLATLYGHQSGFAVAAGDVVEAGQPIGFIGSTGASTGPHLHFEVRRGGVPEDPLLHYLLQP